MRKSIQGFLEKIFNPFLTDLEIYRKVSNLNLHQQVNLAYLNDQIAKNSIDPTKVNLGLLSKITFSEQSTFRGLSTDDLFIMLISMSLFVTFILRNTGIYEKLLGKIATSTKKDIKEIRKFINYGLGFLYLIYSLYMIKLIFSNKQYILASRMVYVATYGIAGITIAISFFSFLFE